MRRWHRMLAPWFAWLLLLLALTGVATQVTAVIGDMATAQRPAVTDKGTTDKAAAGQPPKRSPIGQWNHWFKKLHSGEMLGPIGIAANLLGGIALLFFAGSGFWMYLSMWLRRQRARRRGR